MWELSTSESLDRMLNVPLLDIIKSSSVISSWLTALQTASCLTPLISKFCRKLCGVVSEAKIEGRLATHVALHRCSNSDPCFQFKYIPQSTDFGIYQRDRLSRVPVDCQAMLPGNPKVRLVQRICRKVRRYPPGPRTVVHLLCTSAKSGPA